MEGIKCLLNHGVIDDLLNISISHSLALITSESKALLRIGVFTGETTAHKPLYELHRWLFDLQSKLREPARHNPLTPDRQPLNSYSLGNSIASSCLCCGVMKHTFIAAHQSPSVLLPEMKKQKAPVSWTTPLSCRLPSKSVETQADKAAEPTVIWKHCSLRWDWAGLLT